MARAAHQNSIHRIVTAAVSAMNQMMNVEVSGRPATRHAAAAAIATPDQPRDARWNVLMRALGDIAVDRSDVLRVAKCALHGGAIDRDLRTGAILPASAAPLAQRHGDLELRAS